MNGAVIRTVVIDASVDDDLSEVLDFGKPVHVLWVHSPTLTSATVTLQASISPDTEPAASSYIAVASDIHGGAGTAGGLVLLRENEVAGFRHFKVATGAGQAADRTFTVGAVYL